VILPAAQTGAERLVTDDATGVYDPNRIYITTDRTAAVMYAAMHPSNRGMVYEVDPVDPVEDPDCSEPGLSFSALRARVITARKVKAADINAVRNWLGGGQ
jgi:hypothetical protein